MIMAGRNNAGLNDNLIGTQKVLCAAASIRRRAPSSQRCFFSSKLHTSALHGHKGGHDVEFEDFLVLSSSARSVLCNASTPEPRSCEEWNQCRGKKWATLASAPANNSANSVPPPCVNITCAYYAEDACGPGGANALPDIEGVTPRVHRYAQHLVSKMGLGAWGSWTTVQYRFGGKDWSNHNRAFMGSCIPYEGIKRQVNPAAHHTAHCVVANA